MFLYFLVTRFYKVSCQQKPIIGDNREIFYKKCGVSKLNVRVRKQNLMHGFLALTEILSALVTNWILEKYNFMDKSSLEFAPAKITMILLTLNVSSSVFNKRIYISQGIFLSPVDIT